MVIYAAGFSLIKVVTPDYISPAGFVALRVLGATPLLWLSGMFIKEQVEKKDIWKFALLSLAGVSINQSLFVKGLSLTSPISGAIIMITSPLLVMVMGNLVLKERFTWQRVSGILIGLGGAALLILSGENKSGKADNLLGDVYIFLNALSWGTFLVLVKPMMKKYHTITVLKWVFLFGCAVLIPLGYTGMADAKWELMNSFTVFSILFVVVGVTFVAYLLNIFGLKALSPAVVSAYIYLQPLMAAGIALYLGQDSLYVDGQFDWMKVVSAVLIFGGVMMASWEKRSSPREKA